MAVQHVRRDKREKLSQAYTVGWEEAGLTRSAEATASEVSHAGISLSCAVDLPVGTRVYLEEQNSSHKAYGVVRRRVPTDTSHLIGVELEEQAELGSAVPSNAVSNYYELLQISSNAEISTIERIYRFLAARYHPDNPRTGDSEVFISITRAYKVLSNPDSRAAYDEELQGRTPAPSAEFASVDFMDGLEGEVNRRVAVLALLYRKCRTSPDDPRVSLADLEAAMGFPREYLDFTTWYLRSKKYITREDNSDFSLTALGVDYVEENYTKTPILNQLLGTGSEGTRSAKNTDADDDALRLTSGLQLSPAAPVDREMVGPEDDR